MTRGMRLTHWSGRGLLSAVCTSALAALACTATPASAAAPETPSILPPIEVHAETATFAGVLDPGQVGGPGTYEQDEYDFLYKESSTECKGGSAVPVPSLESQGAGEEFVAQGVEGLTKGTQYTVCLQVKGTGGEAVSAPATFTTTIPPEAPTGEEAISVGPTAATLKGVLNANEPGDPGSYEFLYRQSETECEGEKSISGHATGAHPEPVETQVSELLPDMPYTFCLRATNEAGEEVLGAPVTFTAPVGAPTIPSESVSNIEGTDVTLEAGIDANGTETTHHFEWGTALPYVYKTLESASIGTGDAEQSVSTRITGLMPGTTYHYRVVASNAQSPSGGTPGADKTFTTPATPISPTEACPNAGLRAEQPFGLTLPDCRAYEMVSPVETNGQDATDAAINSEPRVALSGEAITYASRGGFEDPEGGVQESQLLSRRGPEGWKTQAITPLHEPKDTDSAPSYEAAAFTSELTAGLANSNASLTDEAPRPAQEEKNLYLTQFSPVSHRYIAEVTDPMGASTDLSHVVFGELGEVSEWVDGTVVSVSVTNSHVSMSASVGSQVPAFAPGLGRRKDTWHAVSSDGSRVYFTSPAQEDYEGNRQLYVRVNADQPQSPMSGEVCTVAGDACTIEVSASQRTTADPHGPQSARYWGASANGERVFFTSSEELTDTAYTGPEDNAPNLYEYNLATGVLSDLTVDSSDVAEGAAVLGVVQISEDGSYIYFVAKGGFAAGASEQQCREETAEERAGTTPKQGNLGCNLYVSHDGEIALIATLSPKDKSDWAFANGVPSVEPGPAINSAVLSPNGDDLAFMSELGLTGYDNTQSQTDQCEGEISDNAEVETGKCREVYLYAAQSNSLVCASCDPSGARPVGPSGLSKYGSHFAFAEYRSRALLQDGTLFFNSSDALVPGASNGMQNVYEYRSGHVYAISALSGRNPSFFLDASPNGRDVFFGTADELLAQDKGTNVVVYDARVGGGFPAPTSPAPCGSGDSCKPPPSPQSSIFGTPASGTFSGPGNVPPASMPGVVPKKKTAGQLRAERLKRALKACRKAESKRKRAACERSARKRYGASKTRKASNKGRKGR